MKHFTPGDWRVDGEIALTVNAHDPSHPGGFVTILAALAGSDHATLNELRANARLIASAPRLLVAANTMLNALDAGANLTDHQTRDFRALLRSVVRGD